MIYNSIYTVILERIDVIEKKKKTWKQITNFDRKIWIFFNYSIKRLQIITKNICTFIKTNILKIPKQIRINNQQIFDDYSQIRYHRYQFYKSFSITTRKPLWTRVYKIPLVETEGKNVIVKAYFVRTKKEGE